MITANSMKNTFLKSACIQPDLHLPKTRDSSFPWYRFCSEGQTEENIRQYVI